MRTVTRTSGASVAVTAGTVASFASWPGAHSGGSSDRGCLFQAARGPTEMDCVLPKKIWCGAVRAIVCLASCRVCLRLFLLTTKSSSKNLQRDRTTVARTCRKEHFAGVLQLRENRVRGANLGARRPVLWPCDRAPPRGARALLPATRPRASGPLGALLSSPALDVRLPTAL